MGYVGDDGYEAYLAEFHVKYSSKDCVMLMYQHNYNLTICHDEMKLIQ